MSKKCRSEERTLAPLAERKKIETLFGEAKRILSLMRLRLRGPSGARDEFLLTAIVQPRRLAQHSAIPNRTPSAPNCDGQKSLPC